MSQISAEAVRWAYRLFLDREPESDQGVQESLECLETTKDVRQHFLHSEEYLLKNEHRGSVAQSPFFHYATSFDPIELMQRHAVRNLQARPGFLTNFLGVHIDPKFFPTILTGREGQVEGIPIPANWHADIAEWGTALRAIELAGNTFTMIELGCGWGCWMNNTGVAARATGRGVQLIGIEGDEHHLEFARESLATNGFQDDQVSLHRGIASARSGFALFPRQDVAGTTWGSEPIFDATVEQRRIALASGSFDELPMVLLADLIGKHSRIDLLHIDIQGGEANLVKENLDLIRTRVAYLLIGTHSKQIEGSLYDTLLGSGWRLEMERAAIFELVDGTPHIRVDGVQGWRNCALLPA
ncbi:MAG TPA: class I SAM-dependent methyltransferase [Lysobacter sp.]